jgi:hypothetical protein
MRKKAEITLDLVRNKLSYASIVTRNKFAILEEEQVTEGSIIEERLEIQGLVPETFKPEKLEPKTRRDGKS